MKAALLLILLVGVGPARSDGYSRVADSEMTVGGIAIGLSEAAVIRRLGPPKQRTVRPYFFLPVRLDYSGIEVSLDSTVGGIRSTSSKFCTPSKVCPGMSFKRVKEIYGRPIVVKREYGTVMEYYGADTCWLQLSVAKGIVRSVGVACQP